MICKITFDRKEDLQKKNKKHEEELFHAFCSHVFLF